MGCAGYIYICSCCRYIQMSGIFGFQATAEKMNRYFETVDQYRDQQTAQKDQGRVEEVVSQFGDQIGGNADRDLIDPVPDIVTIVEVGVHDNMDQVDEIGLCTDIADDPCKSGGNFSGKGQEKADEADRKDKGDRGIPEIKMIVLKAFAEENAL